MTLYTHWPIHWELWRCWLSWRIMFWLSTLNICLRMKGMRTNSKLCSVGCLVCCMNTMARMYCSQNSSEVARYISLASCIYTNGFFTMLPMQNVIFWAASFFFVRVAASPQLSPASNLEQQGPGPVVGFSALEDSLWMHTPIKGKSWRHGCLWLYKASGLDLRARRITLTFQYYHKWPLFSDTLGGTVWKRLCRSAGSLSWSSIIAPTIYSSQSHPDER